MRLRLLLSLPPAWLCLAAHPIPAQTPIAMPEETVVRPAHKSEPLAIGLSVLGAGVPILVGTQMSGSGELPFALVLGGMLVGPSLGQFYAGSWGRGILGTGIRTGGVFFAALGFATALGEAFCEDTEEKACGGKGSSAETWMILGTITYLGGAIYSLVDAGWAVERYNARQDQKRVFGWSPTVAPAPQGGLKPGVMAWMRF